MRKPLSTRFNIPVAAAYAGMCLIWSSTWMVIKVGLRGAPPLTSVAVRMAIASLLVAIILRVRGVVIPRDTRFVRLGVFLGVFHIVLPYSLVYYGEQHIDSGLAAVIYAILPLLVAILARVALASPLTARKLVGIAVGIAGVGVIFSDSLRIGREQALGTLAVVGSVTASAVGSVATKKWGHGYHAVASLLLPFATATLVTAILALAFERADPRSFDATTWASIVYLAVAGSVVAFALFFWVLQRMDVTLVSYQTFIIPVLAVLLGNVALGEQISVRVGIGAAFILTGISLATFYRGGRRGAG
jgi:drug/metabolite transporter (DMT)-like permease